MRHAFFLSQKKGSVPSAPKRHANVECEDTAKINGTHLQLARAERKKKYKLRLTQKLTNSKSQLKNSQSPNYTLPVNHLPAHPRPNNLNRRRNATNVGAIAVVLCLPSRNFDHGTDAALTRSVLRAELEHLDSGVHQRIVNLGCNLRMRVEFSNSHRTLDVRKK